MGLRGPKSSPSPIVTIDGATFVVVPAFPLVRIDAEDAERVGRHKWTGTYQKNGRRSGKGKNNNRDHVYFCTSITKPNSRQSTANLHRFIMAEQLAAAPKGSIVGFRDHDYFDLRKMQLQLLSRQQSNQRMRKTVKRTVSPYKGVSLEWRYGSPRRWIAQASLNNRVRRIKVVAPNIPDAQLICARAYDCFALANFDNPNPNFPASSYTVDEIQAYKLDASSVMDDVMTIKPSKHPLRAVVVSKPHRQPPCITPLMRAA